MEVRLQQGKTGAKLRIEIVGKLKEVIDRIMARKAAIDSAASQDVRRKTTVRSFALVGNEHGQALTYSALDGRFGKAREHAEVDPKGFSVPRPARQGGYRSR